MAKKISFLKTFLIITLLALSLGYLSDLLTQRWSWQHINNDLSDVMDISLAALNPDRVANQALTPNNKDTADYNRIKEQLLKLGVTFKKKGVDSVYVVIQRDNKILFLVDSVETSHPRYSAPGTIYEEPPQELLNVLQNGTPILTQPYTDEYGSFVSYFKPVQNFEDNKIVGVMGVDIDYVWALNQIREDRLYTLTITTFLYLFSSILFFYLHKRQQSKQELSEGQKRFESIVQTSSDAIMTLEPPDWIFTGGNPATVRMFNAKNEAEFVSKSPGQLSPEKQPDGQLSMEKAKKMIEKALLKGSNFFEWTHKKITGETFPTEILLTRFEIDGEPIVQATVRDISKRKKDEGALEEQKRDLEELNSLMVGREIKIIELKEEIVKLKEELKKK